MAEQQNSQNRQSKKSSGQSVYSRSKKKSSGGPGRGWHGDPEGHARAGSQSHKNK